MQSTPPRPPHRSAMPLVRSPLQSTQGGWNAVKASQADPTQPHNSNNDDSDDDAVDVKEEQVEVRASRRSRGGSRGSKEGKKGSGLGVRWEGRVMGVVDEVDDAKGEVDKE